MGLFPELVSKQSTHVMIDSVETYAANHYG